MLHIGSLFAFTIALSAAADAVSSSSETELWAGHQINWGRQRLPFRGEVTTRMDAYVLARVRRDGDRIELVQETCRVRFAPVGRVQVSLRDDYSPETTMVFVRDDDGRYTGSNRVAWNAEDVDGDGRPGLTVAVDAPVCSGSLYVSNRSTTRARAGFYGERFRGTAAVRTRQEVLGARGACLSLFAPNTDERTRGPFAFVPVAAGTTCADLFERGWPVDAAG